MKRCLICKDPIPPGDNLTRRPRRDKVCCGATCRKRLQRLRAHGHVPRTLCIGQMELPYSPPPDRQPQDRSGSPIVRPDDL